MKEAKGKQNKQHKITSTIDCAERHGDRCRGGRGTERVPHTPQGGGGEGRNRTIPRRDVGAGY